MVPRWHGSGPAPTRGRSVVALLLGVVLAVSGCTISVSSSSPGSAPAPDGGVDRPASTETDQRSDDERVAVGVVDRYWQRHFPELTGRRYDSPQVAGPYTGTSGPRCGGQASVPGNAFYCPSGDFLAWDEDLMRAGYDRIGDAWVYLIIAHEWGHAIQARLRRGQVSVAAELQADCLAGASLLGAVADGELRLEPGDEEEIARTLAVVADDFPWTDQSSHGNAAQRTAAFEAGANNGLRACI
ncbi:MAG TPA: neutral zinc metallopeptidase [Pseudonocardia sp.]|nr:neutral zinc metallopeptidase [Pseudonocardia sp.]